MFDWFAPKIFNEGYLPEQDGHAVYFMEAGNRKGRPVLIFHGGPGGSAKLKHAACFSRRYRIIMFDQRGCGKSLPRGEIRHNTTEDLLEDARRLLHYLGIEETVIVRGGSWGAALALLFAESWPEKVDKLVLSQIFLADDETAEWVNRYSSWFYPDIWQQITAAAGSDKDVVDLYAKMINSPQAENQLKAASLYGNYERVLGSLEPQLRGEELTPEDILSARIYLNYAAQKFMLKNNMIMQHIDKIKNIPTLIVHNRLDMVCPLAGAWRLHKALPHSRLVIVPEKGHVGDLLYETIRRETKSFLA